MRNHYLLFIGLMMGVLLMSPGTAADRCPLVATLCLLDGKEYQQQACVLDALQQVPPGVDLVVLPHLPYLTFQLSQAAADLQPFADFARQRQAYLALALTEKEADRTYATAILFDRQGEVAGRYRQTHVPLDEALPLTAGSSLPVFDTDFGRVGLTVGADFYFPEPYQVLALKGADLVTWHHFPERLRDYSMWEPLLMARALDGHQHLVVATYADHRTYITNHWEIGMPGAAWGRSQILNRVGCPVADTGYEAGVALARLDFDRRKVSVYEPDYQGENIFYVNNYGDRQACAPVAAPYTAPVLPAYKKRTCRLAVGWFPRSEIWRQGIVPQRMLDLISSARALHPDLLLLSEMATNEQDEVTRQTFEQVADLARELNCYLAIGGIGNAEQSSILRLWDREGNEVYQQPLYWVKGFPEIKVFDTDFGRLGAYQCGDLYMPEFQRTLALLGAEIIIDASQMWGASGRLNETMLRARAIDNAVWLACAHWPTSDPSQRCLIIDPYGQIMASSNHHPEGLITHDLNLDQQRVYYAGHRADQVPPGETGIPSYYTADLPEIRPGWREWIFAARRPELYQSLPQVNEITRSWRGNRIK